MITCEDGVKIHSWLLLHPDARRQRNPTIVFFHGNAGNIGLRLPNAIQMYRDLNANVLLVEYRGYGDSDNVPPTEAGLKLDAEAALRYTSEHSLIDTSRIFIFGRSLGGAVGFHLAHYAEKRSLPLAGIIVENTFVSISRMVDHLMPYVAPLKSLVLRIGWDSSRIVPHLRVPVLYLAGAEDQLVPHSHMLELYKASAKASSCARMYIIPGGTHNETWMQGGREYWDRIRRFFEETYAIQARGSSRSLTSFDDVPLDDSGNGATSIGMGSDTEARRCSIPIMPSSIVDMAREATQAVVSGVSDKTKQKDI